MEFFEIENLNSIRKIVINNPRKKNAMNREAYGALATLLNKAALDETVKCVVLTGKGDFYRYGNKSSSKSAINYSNPSNPQLWQ